MRVYITGQRGMIARNLSDVLKERGHVVLTDDDLFSGPQATQVARVRKTNEVCVHGNSEREWIGALGHMGVDLVVHNAAVVGTDVVALDPSEACLTNVQGTYNIVRAANAVGAQVCYMGTTVVYDTYLHQECEIHEDSPKMPRTYYGVQKLAGEQIVTSMAKRWSVIRPLFAYGSKGDMNSLIAKSIYAAVKGKDVDIFLDPDKVKDYLHVRDFCRAVAMICEASGTNTDWNVAAETPLTAGQVLDVVERIIPGAKGGVRWHPDTDYLGNHRLSSSKMRHHFSWRPSISLAGGIASTAAWIMENESTYDPLVHLDRAETRGVDLKSHFPSHLNT